MKTMLSLKLDSLTSNILGCNIGSNITFIFGQTFLYFNYNYSYCYNCHNDLLYQTNSPEAILLFIFQHNNN